MAKKRNGFDNDAWVKDHFEMIVDKYGGKYPYILVTRGKVFPVRRKDDVLKIEEKIRRKYGRSSLILGMPVPKPRDFLSILSISILEKLSK